jgi:DNA-binding transcriptional LysR family regulator
MELRHLRYFVAVAEEQSFVHAAKRLRVAQPALSRQVRDLENEIGVALFHRLPRGVRLTTAGETFLTDARCTLEMAARAVTTARRANQRNDSVLYFGNGVELGVYAPVVADLLAAFRGTYDQMDIRILNHDQTEQLASLRDRQVDVAATFLMTWPATEFESHRLVYSPLTGALLPASHPLAAKTSVRLKDLQDLTFLHRSGEHWPENFRAIKAAMRERGWRSSNREQPAATPSVFVEIAAGDAWSFANEAIAAPVSAATSSVVYRPFADPPIPAWLALVWLSPTAPRVERLVEMARALGMDAAAQRRSSPAVRVSGERRRS